MRRAPAPPAQRGPRGTVLRWAAATYASWMDLVDHDVSRCVRSVLAEPEHRDASELGHVCHQAASKKLAPGCGVGVIHEVLDRAAPNRGVGIDHRFVLRVSMQRVR